MTTPKDTDDRRLILSVNLLRGIKELADAVRRLEADREELVRLGANKPQEVSR